MYYSDTPEHWKYFAVFILLLYSITNKEGWLFEFKNIFLSFDHGNISLSFFFFLGMAAGNFPGGKLEQTGGCWKATPTETTSRQGGRGREKKKKMLSLERDQIAYAHSRVYLQR